MGDLDELVSKIQKVRERLGLTHSSPWFRGHASRRYELTPTLLRPEFLKEFRVINHKQFEKNLACDFVTRAGNEVSTTLDTWQLLGLMRHYEMPTRLLDWTTSLSVALYFAVADAPNPALDGPHIWLMNPHLLNKKSTGKVIVFDSVDVLDISYFECLHGTKTLPFNGPVALKLPLNNPRIRAQRGCFTFHGSGLDGNDFERSAPLNKFGERIAKRIDIPIPLIEKIQTLLTLEGVDEYFVYPELHNLSRSLKRHALKQGAGRIEKPTLLQ